MARWRPTWPQQVQVYCRRRLAALVAGCSLSAAIRPKGKPLYLASRPRRRPHVTADVRHWAGMPNIHLAVAQPSEAPCWLGVANLRLAAAAARVAPSERRARVPLSERNECLCVFVLLCHWRRPDSFAAPVELRWSGSSLAKELA